MRLGKRCGSKRLVLDDHALGRIPGARFGVRNDQRDRFADVAHLFARQDRLQRPMERTACRQPREGFARQAADLLAREVLRGEHEQHAGRRARRTSITPHDPRMRVRRAHDDRVCRVGRLNVGNEAAATSEEALIFQTRLGYADCGGGRTSCCVGW